MTGACKSLLITVMFLVLASQCLAQSGDNETSAKIDQAKSLMEAGKIDESLEVLNRSLENSPTPLAFYYRGMAYSLKGLQGLAIKDYTEAIKGDPSQSAFHARRGISKLSLGEVSDAMPDFNKALEIEPTSSSILSFRARAAMMSGRMNQALEDINRAIQSSANNSGLYKLRGDILTAMGNYEKAVLDYDRAIQLNPGFATAFNNRGIALAHINRIKEAVEDLNSAMDLASSRANQPKTPGFPSTPW